MIVDENPITQSTLVNTSQWTTEVMLFRFSRNAVQLGLLAIRIIHEMDVLRGINS